MNLRFRWHVGRSRARVPLRRKARAGLSLLVLACVTCSPRPDGDTVVVFVLDTVRQDALGCYGNDLDPTPRMDALARQGIRFDQAISSSGWTLPAIGSLFTGTWPTLHGAMGRGVTLTPLRPEFPTAAEVLQEAGLRTLGFANAAFVSPMVAVDRGFDVFDHEYSHNQDSRPADVVVDLAIRELRALRGRPAFFFLHLFDPHLDYAPPAGYDTLYTGGRTSPETPLTMETCLRLQTGPGPGDPPSEDDVAYVRAVYQGEIRFVDEQVGRFVDELVKQDLYRRSTIVVTSDHGEEFWEHGGFEHGHTLYDELVRVPLILKLPGETSTTPRVVDAPVRVLDVMPTVFELLGIEKPPSFEGRSLLPLARGEPDADRPVFSESTLYGANRIAWRTNRYKYIQDVETGVDGVGELYDWRADPLETHDLARELRPQAIQMRGALVRFHRDLESRARGLSKPKAVDLGPRRIQELRSLGYIR